MICTAFSDHSWPELYQQLGNPEQLLVLKKPFDSVEVLQLAASLTQKWNLAQSAHQSMNVMSRQNRAILEWGGAPCQSSSIAMGACP